MRRERLRVRWHVAGGRPVRSLVAGTVRAGVPEIVVVPGLGALGYLMPTVHACASWTRVHLLDLPGFGHRTTARLPADLSSVASAAAGWLVDVAPDGVLLVGHSTGAQAALRAAVAAPAPVGALVLGGVTFPPAARRPLPLLSRVARTARHERPGEIPAVLPEYVRGARRLPELLRTTLADRPEDVVPSVRVPVVVVRGAHDHLCPQPWADALAGGASKGRVVVLPGAHNYVYTHPLETSDALRTIRP